ncbi:MAG: hypothetical protein LBG47_10585 [Prevotellaceae bacterium]|jgi:hypothetical protein|nr:hypothetical protein [Prevotellaceae bacterium]
MNAQPTTPAAAAPALTPLDTPKDTLKRIIDHLTAALADYTRAHGHNSPGAQGKARIITALTQAHDALDWAAGEPVWTIAQDEVLRIAKVFGELSEVTLTIRPHSPRRIVTVDRFTRLNPTRTVRVSHLL